MPFILHFLTLLGLAIISEASPLAATTPPYCKAVTSAVSKVKALSTATPFCSSFLHIPTITSLKTVSTTSIVSSTKVITTGTLTVTASPVIQTVTSSSTTTAISVIFTTIFSTTGTDTVTAPAVTSVSTFTETALAPTCTSSAVAKRAPSAPSVPSVLKSLASAVLSSACSCLAIPTPTLSTTLTRTAMSTKIVTLSTAATATSTPTSTSTLVLISTDGASSTSQVISEVAAQSTITPTVSTSTTITSTSTPVCAATPTCSAASTAENGFYELYYTGSGYTESPSNPGNTQPSYPPLTSYFPASDDVCNAVSRCADISYADPDIYWSFDLHFRISTNQWECVQYFDNNENPAYFSVVDSDVSVAYGYSL